MERQLEGEADLPAAGGSPRCDPVGDDEDEMSICDAFDEAVGSNSIRPAARGEALDDEAPAAMATGGEASSSAPPEGKRPRRTKSKTKGGRKAKMGANQRRDESNRERRETGREP
mmetsp:Transcript_4254/g.13752  ORF Transcript_4254/g.13752 Transcript_4254/m.13752 type:complete len:115 (+) Transcript_4254:115-459(+)